MAVEIWDKIHLRQDMNCLPRETPNFLREKEAFALVTRTAMADPRHFERIQRRYIYERVDWNCVGWRVTRSEKRGACSERRIFPWVLPRCLIARRSMFLFHKIATVSKHTHYTSHSQVERLPWKNLFVFILFRV